MSNILAELQASLPNFPAELLEEWLQPYALSEGWPPAPNSSGTPVGRWRYLLRNRSLDYWRSIVWRREQRHISIHELDAKYQEVMVLMVLGAVKGRFNLYSASIPDMGQRFERIKAHIAAHGTLPKPPALLVERDSGLAILDGNHRMAAYFYCYGYFNLEVDTDLQLNTKDVQSFWIGEAAPS